MYGSRQHRFILAFIFSLHAVVIQSQGIEPLEDFLCSTGYICDSRGGRETVTPDIIAEKLRDFQGTFGLPVTGVDDVTTQAFRSRPRCGNWLFGREPTTGDREGRFQVVDLDRKWTQDLRWRLNETHPTVSASEAQRVLTESVAEWTKWMTTITITESTDTNSDLIVNFPEVDENGVHNGDKFNFRNTTLAHAFYPTRSPQSALSGDVHFNTRHSFDTTEPPANNRFSLMQITVHELGHSLGINHTNISGAVMYPFVRAGLAYAGLHQDDISAIQFLYGLCGSDPCQNGGSCTLLTNGTSYSCSCADGFSGTNCEIAAPCASNPCQNQATCTNVGTGYTCQCTAAYTGTDCETLLPCSNNPCQNSGTCTDNPGGSGYMCRCPSTHTGTNCETLLPCNNSPCVNGGTCFNNPGGAGFMCTCPSTHTGTNCETLLPCSRSPCQNGGTCNDNDLGGYFMCQCPMTHTGTTCETLLPCSSSPCQNGGTCNNDAGGTGYTCQCPTTHTGTNCETVIVNATPCTTNPCQNNGVCMNSGSTRMCMCSAAYTGTSCETLLPCSNSPCQNGGMCNNNAGGAGYTCQCPSTHTGTNCETLLPCSSSPCQNGGTCNNNAGGAGYTCACPSTHMGTNCETSTMCNTNPCVNGGTCRLDSNADDGYTCDCPNIYTGSTCAISVCAVNPCQNGGQCRVNAAVNSGYTCACPLFFGGQNCGQNLINHSTRHLASVLTYCCCFIAMLFWPLFKDFYEQ